MTEPNNRHLDESTPQHQSELTTQHQHQAELTPHQSGSTAQHQHQARETWLQQAIELLRPLFAQSLGLNPNDPQALTSPLMYPSNIRVSVGFGGGRGSKLKVLGEYWQARSSEDERPCIFISPTIGDPLRALDVLAHELVHACVPNAGHGKEFKRIALKIGLEGKMTATVASPELKAKLQALSAKLGPYPHAALNPAQNPKKKQGTRLLKAECACCGYTVRLTKKWAELGAPVCPIDQVAMVMKENEGES